MFMHSTTDFRFARPVGRAAGATGIGGSTLIDTPAGWRPAHALRRGMLVHTLDGGARPLTEVGQGMSGVAGMMLVPGGALSNCDDLWLMPGQELVLAGQVVSAVLGVPQVLVAAEALDGLLGCRLVRGAVADVFTLRFSRDEVVFANSGALVMCPAGNGGVAGRTHDGFETLAGARARALTELIAAGALCSDGERRAA